MCAAHLPHTSCLRPAPLPNRRPEYAPHGASDNALPKKGYACEKTRDNNGVCYTPGPPADGAYTAALKELRKYATKKGKGGASNADGVSSANSAAF